MKVLLGSGVGDETAVLHFCIGLLTYWFCPLVEVNDCWRTGLFSAQGKPDQVSSLPMAACSKAMKTWQTQRLSSCPYPNLPLESGDPQSPVLGWKPSWPPWGACHSGEFLARSAWLGAGESQRPGFHTAPALRLGEQSTKSQPSGWETAA